LIFYKDNTIQFKLPERGPEIICVDLSSSPMVKIHTEVLKTSSVKDAIFLGMVFNYLS
jgi:hypothetical protein